MTETVSTGALLGDLARSVPDLMRKEGQLLRAEMRESVSRAATAAGLMAAGVAVAVVALNVLAAALVAALTDAGAAPGWAALIVGGALALVALGLARKGAADLKALHLMPGKTARALERDAALVRETVR